MYYWTNLQNEFSWKSSLMVITHFCYIGNIRKAQSYSNLFWLKLEHAQLLKQLLCCCCPQYHCWKVFIETLKQNRPFFNQICNFVDFFCIYQFFDRTDFVISHYEPEESSFSKQWNILTLMCLLNENHHLTNSFIIIWLSELN